MGLLWEDPGWLRITTISVHCHDVNSDEIDTRDHDNLTIFVMFQGLSMHLANEIANTCGTQEHLLYAKLCQKDIFLDNSDNDFANVM